MSEPRTQWLFYAIASGGCAALNGVFAKLTTTKLTTSWAAATSALFGIEQSSLSTEYAVRGLFLLLNLAFNGVMWGLFTRALTLSSSTVRVSVINTSANFMATALLGAAVFSEELPGLWWLGAGLLMAGSVIIGRRDEAKDANGPGMAGQGSPENTSDPKSGNGVATSGVASGRKGSELGSLRRKPKKNELRAA